MFIKNIEFIFEIVYNKKCIYIIRQENEGGKRLEQKEIYLDNSATTKVSQSSAEAVLRAMTINYGNPASLHQKGYRAEQLITAAKKVFASELSCLESELYFTSGATESNNLSILGTASVKKRQGKKIITTAIEHASVLACFDHLKTMGYETVLIEPNADGVFDPMDFYRAVDDQTILVSTMFVNNEMGMKLPIMEIGKAVKKKNPNTVFHVDAVQGFGKLPLRLKNSPIDLLSASGHKIYAPKGIGLLYLKRGVRIDPLFYGGGQQNGIRVGTENVPLIAGFAEAFREVAENREQYRLHFETLKAQLLKAVSVIPDISVNTAGDCVPYIVNLSIDRVRSEVMLHFLEQDGIYVSSGSACSKGAKSHVLKALGLSDRRIDSALRISFSPETTTEDLDFLVERLELGIKTLMKSK
jgi:cysteine desulfurase